MGPAGTQQGNFFFLNTNGRNSLTYCKLAESAGLGGHLDLLVVAHAIEKCNGTPSSPKDSVTLASNE